MTEPSQYFKGRTVQEQMDEVIGYVDTRAAEVATAAIASDVAQVHQDMLDADADATAAAASAAAAAGTLANAVKKTGEASQSIAGDIAVAGNLSGGSVTVPAPVNNTDAANKKYVDDYHDAAKLNITDVNSYAVGLTGVQAAAGEKTWINNQTFNRNLSIVRTGTDVSEIPTNSFNTFVKEVYDGANHLNASEFVTKNANGATWNVRNFFHYFKDSNDVLHTIRMGIYYTIENTASSIIVKRVINIFLDGNTVNSDTEYTKTVTI